MDKFDFKKRLGVGNFGEVWLVHDVTLNLEYALKCIPKNKVNNQANFFQEAQLLQQAQHSNIVEVREAGILVDGRVYVAMEYCPKGSLEDEASGGYVPLTRAKKLMIDILRGLEFAHSKDIIHRDIKPGNILIGPTLEGKLSDFGLALSRREKIAGSFLKDYLYGLHLAPEIIAGEEYTKLTDIYACGITLYRLVNGDTYINYIKQESQDEIIQKIQKGNFPDRESYRWFIPRKVRSIINKAISIDPSRRYATAIEMRRALEQLELEINWNERRIPHGMKWTGNKFKTPFTYSVTLSGSGRSWSISLEKGKSKHSLRHVSQFCQTDLSRGQSERFVKKMLQGVVDGKLNF